MFFCHRLTGFPFFIPWLLLTCLLSEGKEEVENSQEWILNQVHEQAISQLLSLVATSELSTLTPVERMSIERCTMMSRGLVEHAVCLEPLFIDRHNEQRENSEVEDSTAFAEHQRASQSKNEEAATGHRRARRSSLAEKQMTLLNVARNMQSSLTSATQIFPPRRRLLNSAAEVTLRHLAKTIRRRQNTKKFALAASNSTAGGTYFDANRDKRLNAAVKKLLKEEAAADGDEFGWQMLVKAVGQAERQADEYKLPPWRKKLLHFAQTIVRNFARGNMSGGTDGKEDLGNYRFLSPRLMPLFPHEKHTRQLLSPDVLSLYKTTGVQRHNFLPLQSLIGGLAQRQQDAILQIVLEMSRSTDRLLAKKDRLTEPWDLPIFLRELKAVSRPVVDVLLNKTVRDHRLKVFQRVERTYTSEQKSQLRKKGYFLLTPKQRQLLYQNVKGGERLLTEGSMPTDEQSLRKSVQHLVRELSDEQHQRKAANENTGLGIFSRNKPSSGYRRIIALRPVVLHPTIMHPSVLVGIVLSPTVLCPLILNPVVLGGRVLSPSVLSPVIVSPAVLFPVILSPRVLSPVLLSPLVLSPVILNPGVLSPALLNPIVLSPVILSPQALGGMILSPRVLSPAIKSKSVASVLFASPSVLSRKRR